MPSLVVKEGPLTGRRLDVESVLVLGRSDADVIIDDSEMSRRHALVRSGDAGFEIEDLDSLNGTFVNGRRIEVVTSLVTGDVVRLGKTVLEVDGPATHPTAEAIEPLDEATQPAAPERPPRLERPPQPPRFEELGARCRECGAELGPTARFCSECGVARNGGADRVPALAPAGRLDDELRPVTALFADLVGSTGLGERLSPDEVKELIGECVSRMARVVEQFGGVVQAYMGDGIAAYFGTPTAHEDDPERAARAALRIVDVVAEYGRDISAAWGVEEFDVRVGINSGQTAVGNGRCGRSADRRSRRLDECRSAPRRLPRVRGRS